MAKTISEIKREAAVKKTVENAKQNNSTSTTSAPSSSGTNYQQDINDAVSRGDYASAAKYEQLRNEKINYLNASGTNIYGATTTNNYSQYLGTTPSNSNSPTSTTQYTPVGTYNDSGVSDWAKKQIEANQQIYIDAMARGDIETALQAHRDNEEIRKGYGYSGGDDGSQYIPLGYDYTEPKPTYEPKYDPQMDALLDQILNRDSFSYDVATDPMYQQYAKMYQREGDRAMSNTMAEAAASAGGMNSYAITAAQQANNYYNSQLNDVIPELYNTAYQMYLQDIDNKARDLGLLQNMDATQYARYRDTMADWQSDRNFAYGMYRDDIADSQWNRSFDYNSYVDNRNFDYTQSRDNVYDTQWGKEFNATQGQIALENSWKDEDRAKEEARYLISLGIKPDANLIKKANLDEATVALELAAVQTRQNNKGTAKGVIDYGDVNNPGAQERTSFIGLGLGPVANMDELVLSLVEAGGVILYDDGKVSWAEGWSPSNYRQKLIGTYK